MAVVSLVMQSLPSEAEGLKREAYELLAAGSYQEACELFSTLVELYPGIASPRLGLAQTLFFQPEPDLEGALRALRQAIEISPQWAELYHWLGSVQEKNGLLSDAIASFEKAIHLDPADSRPLISLGACLTKAKEYKQAIHYLRQGIALKPHYAEASARLFLADALRGCGRREEACSEWRAILEMPSEYPDYDRSMKEAKAMLERYGSGRPQHKTTRRK